VTNVVPATTTVGMVGYGSARCVTGSEVAGFGNRDSTVSDLKSGSAIADVDEGTLPVVGGTIAATAW
jgi:hypothetical protein